MTSLRSPEVFFPIWPHVAAYARLWMATLQRASAVSLTPAAQEEGSPTPPVPEEKPTPAGEAAAPETEEAWPARKWTAEEVFREHAGRVFALARRMLGNDADAEDVTQEVLLQVVRKLADFRGEAALTTWLHRVTTNAALILRRQAARRARLLDNQPDLACDSPAAGTRRHQAAPDQVVLNRELRQRIDEAIAQLPPLYRDVYVLADVDGLSNAEVADTLSLSLPAVKSRLHRARLLMRDFLAPYVRPTPH
jgi:RNA polymerase sigma-70 factor, ECF subfamily